MTGRAGTPMLGTRPGLECMQRPLPLHLHARIHWMERVVEIRVVQVPATGVTSCRQSHTPSITAHPELTPPGPASRTRPIGTWSNKVVLATSRIGELSRA